MDIPVGKYTGSMQINIPIYTINAKGLKIPISLLYQSNGTKVSEEAPWTGLGWRLKAGGSITQVVKGNDDFGYYQSRIIPDFQEIEPSLPNPINAPYYLSAATSGSFTCSDAIISTYYVNGLEDSEPDIFKYSFLGYSGEFILDWETGQFVNLTDNKIKIELINPINTESAPFNFRIITPEGHRFTFELKEEGKIDLHYQSNLEGPLSSIINLSNKPDRSFRTYKLRYINTNEGDFIEYEYDIIEDLKNYPNISQEVISYFPTSGSNSSRPPSSVNVKDLITSRFYTSQDYSYLKNINFNGGQVIFETSVRLDLQGAKKLDGLKVQQSSSNIIKSFSLQYDYFQGHSDGNNLDNFLPANNVSKTSQELTDRLKLMSVQEGNLPPYEFTYNENYPLPKKTSLATDYWGYYNGKTTNESLLPNPDRFNIPIQSISSAFDTNNKSANLNYCISGVLSKIKYPTGGYSEFEYELNSFDNYYAPPISSEPTNSVELDTRSDTNILSSTALALHGLSTEFIGDVVLSTRGCADSDAYADTYLRITHYNSDLRDLIEGAQYGLMYQLSVRGLLPEATNFNQTNYNQYIVNEELVQMNYNDPNELILDNQTYTIGEGIVLFQLFGGCGTYNGTTNSSGAFINLNYFDYGITNSISQGGGVRIKEVKTYSDQNQLELHKRYEYNGGKLMSPLVFAKKRFMNTLIGQRAK